MAGMGSFTRKRQYNQENAALPLRGIAQLMGLNQEANKDMVGAVDSYGQDLAGSRVAQLMGSDEFAKLNPEQAQAKVLEATGGRGISEQMMKQLGLSLDSKGNVQKNTWNEDAATKLFGRQLSRGKINNTESMNRVNAKVSPSQELLSPSELADRKESIRQYDTAIKDKSIDEATRSRLREERDTLAGELVYGASAKPSAAATGFVTGVDKNGQFETKPNATKNKPKWNTATYAKTDPAVRSFIDSKYGSEVTESKDGYYFRGQKLTPAYLQTLKGK